MSQGDTPLTGDKKMNRPHRYRVIQSRKTNYSVPMLEEKIPMKSH